MSDRPRLQVQRWIIRAYLVALGVFVANKSIARLYVLQHDFPEFFRILVLSIPNTIEAIMGLLSTVGILQTSRRYFAPRFDHIRELTLNLMAVFLSGTYVLTQEFKIHNLDGRNT